jgi:hypothetical protein
MKMIDKIDIDKERSSDVEELRKANNSKIENGPKKDDKGFCTKCIIF